MERRSRGGAERMRGGATRRRRARVRGGVARWGLGSQRRGALYRAAQAILGVRAQGTNHGEIPGRFLLRERKTREEEGEADVWVRERGERSGARAGERAGRAGPSVHGRVLSAEGACRASAAGGPSGDVEGSWAEVGSGPRGKGGELAALTCGARAAGENACARPLPERGGAREWAALEEMGLGRERSGRDGARFGPRMRERRPVGLGYVERGKRAVRGE